ncbi:hypothetical protein GCM10027047_37040 [Rhodococcus aerolatus]
MSMPPGERRRRRRATDPVELPPGVPVDRRTHPEVVAVLGVGVPVLSTPQALDRVSSMVERGAPGAIAFANAHLLTLASTDPGVRDVLRRCALVLNDGAGVSWAARAKGSEFTENLNGTDFTPLLLERAAERGWRVALLGAAPGVAERAAVALRQRLPGLRVCYADHGYFDLERSERVAAQVRASRPHLLLVAMGNPRQERWLDEHLPATGATVGLAVGAFLDFAAGEVARAPRWVRAVHLEWAFRLLLEPRRLFARYVIGIPVFRARVRRDVADPLPVHPRRRAEDRAAGPHAAAANDSHAERHPST